MNAAILGTSNGIISDGYIKAIKESSLFINVKNLSVGASSCAFFPFRLRTIEWDKVDIIFVESLVNDAASLRAKAFDNSHINQYYSDLFSRCNENNVVLVGMLLPGRTRDKYSEEAFNILKNFYDENDVYYLNFDDALNSYAESNQTTVFDLYRDAAHLESTVINDICKGLIEHDFKPDELKLGKSKSKSENFTFININEMIFDKKTCFDKEILNSLLSVNTCYFENEFKLEVVLPYDNFEIYSLVLNANNTHCQFEISGANSCLKNLCFDLIPNNNKIIISPLISTVSIANCSVTFRANKFQDRNSKGEIAYQGKTINLDQFSFEIAGMIIKHN